MPSEEYAKFIAQAGKMRDEIVAIAQKKADAWYSETVDMLKNLNGSDSPKASTNRVKLLVDVPQEIESSSKPPRLRRHMKNFFAEIAGQEFDSNDVRDYLKLSGVDINPARRAAIATILKRFAQKGSIELLEQGRGSMPSRYRAK